VVACGDRPEVRELVAAAPCRVVLYGFGEGNEVRPLGPPVEAEAGRYRCHIGGPAGEAELSPGLGGLSDEIRPSANLGIGWQWTLTRNVALRTELRGYLSLINSNGEFFCSGGCLVSIRGRTLGQAEGLVGLSIGF
jgi:hypothetical protein